MFWHIVLIGFKEGVSSTTKEELFKLGQELGNRCGGASAGILEWKFEKNLDLRKHIHCVQLSIFNSKDAFQMFRNHPAHQEFSENLKHFADWTVADFSS